MIYWSINWLIVWFIIFWFNISSICSLILRSIRLSIHLFMRFLSIFWFINVLLYRVVDSFVLGLVYWFVDSLISLYTDPPIDFLVDQSICSLIYRFLNLWIYRYVMINWFIHSFMMYKCISFSIWSLVKELNYSSIRPFHSLAFRLINELVYWVDYWYWFIALLIVIDSWIYSYIDSWSHWFIDLYIYIYMWYTEMLIFYLV